MKYLLLISFFAIMTGCLPQFDTFGDSISNEELEAFFKKHKVDGNYAVAIKKRSLGSVSYLTTIHGYPNNLSVCEDLITPYNKDESMSVVSGKYYCEELR
jgi:hypothetical protein